MKKIIAIYDTEGVVIAESTLCVLHAGPEEMEQAWINSSHPYRWGDASEISDLKCSVQNCSYEWLMTKVPAEVIPTPREGN